MTEPIGGPDVVPSAQALSPARGLGASAVRGGAVTVVTQVIRSAVQMGGLVALSRLLPPEDVGIMAMVLIVTSFGEVIRDFGLSLASVQASLLTTIERSNLFWTNAALGIVAALFACAVAPVAAELLGEPRLTTITRVVSACLILNSLGAQYQAHLTRELRFAALGWSDVCSTILALVVSLACAVAGMGYWALAVQQLVFAGALLGSRIAMSGWLPGWPTTEHTIRRFVSYSWPLFGSHVLTLATQQVDSIVVARQSGAAALGPYSRAFQLLTLPVAQLSTPLLRVALPLLSQVKDDWSKYHHFLLRGQRVLGYAIVGALSLLAALADPLFVLLLGSEWDDVPGLFRILAVGGCFQSMSFVCYWVFLSKALTRELLRYSIVARSVGVLLIITGSSWGTSGVAVGVTAGLVLAWPMSTWWLVHHRAISAEHTLRLGLRILVAGLYTSLAGSLAGQLVASSPSRLIAVLMGYSLTGLTLLLLPVYRSDFRALRTTGMRLRRLAKDGST